MYKQHSICESPLNEEVKIWRYMDFTKFTCLLDKSALFFSRADKLGDPFEGSYPKYNLENRPIIYKDKIEDKALAIFSQFIKRLREFTFINSWHMNAYESAALWKIYLKSNEGYMVI
jgi:hypothetical protein